MILSIQQLARAVATALEEEVLPTCEPRSWPASRLRSSLGLLQLIIDQAEHEERVLITANGLIRDYLATLGLPDVATAGDAEHDLAALRSESVRLRAMLSDVIRSSAGTQTGEWRRPLHALLRELKALERPIHDEAIRFLPM